MSKTFSNFFLILVVFSEFKENAGFLFFESRWNKLVQRPFEEGDERGLKLVQSILRPIMLRRTKCSTDRDGR